MTFIDKILTFLFLVFFGVLIASAQGKLIIIGGGKRPPEIIQRLITESGVDKKGYIVLLPMASEEQDSSIIFSKPQFINAGIKNVTGFIIKKGDIVPKNIIDSIANASLIYIGGGDQVRFMGIIAGTEVEKAIKICYTKGNVIAGTSAGAAVMSEKMITGVELKHKSTTEDTERQGFTAIEEKNIEISNGLGFIKNAIIDQHFIKRKRQNRLIAVAIENSNFDCIGIDEATAIVVKSGTAEVIGISQVLAIKNKNQKIKVQNGLLGATNLKLDLYLPGDTFKIK